MTGAIVRTVADYTGALDLRRRGSEWVGACPLCRGRDRFRVTQDGRAFCRQCLPDGKNTERLTELHQVVFGEEPRTPPPLTGQRYRSGDSWCISGPRRGTPDMTHEYFDAAEKLLLSVNRIGSGPGKQIWRNPKGAKPPPGGWPLYRLRSLLANPDRPVLVVEGEKTADVANHLLAPNWEVTTCVGGTSSPKTSDWSTMKGRHVVIWPDADSAGFDFAESVEARCHYAGAAAVRQIFRNDLAELPSGWDLADQPPPGFDVEAVLESPGSVVSLPAEDTPDGLRVDTNWRQPPLPRRWLIDGWLAAGRIALLSGRGGAGKSKLAVQLAYAIAAGRQEWFEGGPKLNDIGNPIVFASWEDEREELHRRLLDNPDLRFEGA